jgi:hypothetical protein
MNSCTTTQPQYKIARTNRGWQLVMQNEHFSVMQVFRTEEIAREAVDRMTEFFYTMSAQPPRDRQVA